MKNSPTNKNYNQQKQDQLLECGPQQTTDQSQDYNQIPICDCQFLHSNLSHLQAAALEGRYQCIKRLFDNDQVHVEDEQNNASTSALHLALLHGHIREFTQLLDYNFPVDQKGIHGVTPLIIACQTGSYYLVNQLLKRGADVSASDNSRHSPLYFSCSNGNLKIVQLLLQHNASIDQSNECGETPLMAAVNSGNTECVQYLLSQFPLSVWATDSSGNTLLHCASRIGRARLLGKLLKSGIDIEQKNWLGRTALMDASIKGHLECVKALVKANANILQVDKCNQQAAQLACIHGNKSIILYFLSLGIDVNHRDHCKRTLLMLTAMASCNPRHCQCLTALIQQGANTTLQDNFGNNALYYTSEIGSIQGAQLLISNGCDVNHQNHEGLTALHAAVSNNRLHMVNYLIQCKGSQQLANNQQEYPLCVACKNSSFDIVQALVQSNKVDIQQSSVITGSNLHILAYFKADVDNNLAGDIDQY